MFQFVLFFLTVYFVFWIEKKYIGHYKQNETQLTTLVIIILIMVTIIKIFYHWGDNDNNRIDYID